MSQHELQHVSHKIIPFQEMLLVESRATVSGLSEDANTLVLAIVLDPQGPLKVKVGQALPVNISPANRLFLLYEQAVSDHNRQFQDAVALVNRIGFAEYQKNAGGFGVLVQQELQP